MGKVSSAVLGAVALFGTASVSAQTIDFEGYTDPSNFVTFTDSGATFTGIGDTSGLEISAYTNVSMTGWGTAGPMILCGRSSPEYCGGSFEVEFAQAVSDLQFYFTADDSADSELSVEAFLGAMSLGVLTFGGDGDPFTAHLADLSELGLIDRIEITTPTDDPIGYAYDDFSFTTAVPEPGTWAMMLLGFGAVGLTMRKRQRSARSKADLVEI
jgi:hypothetical protein